MDFRLTFDLRPSASPRAMYIPLHKVPYHPRATILALAANYDHVLELLRALGSHALELLRKKLLGYPVSESLGQPLTHFLVSADMERWTGFLDAGMPDRTI